MDNNIVKIFDTTLRDGEQSPGASMNTEEKIQIAKQLEKLGVDIIEAGFAAASPGDFDAISRIAQAVEKSTICSLARAVERDIKAAGEAVAKANMRRVHTFIATSPIHMEHKLKMAPDEVIRRAVDAVKYAKTFVDDVEFSCEDAGRSDISFLKEITEAVIEAGASTINLPDTVGYRLPTEIGAMVKEMVEFVDNRAIISVHNHNDLGLAVANSLESVLNGARQVECTINGLGERAGNASLEEIVMAMKTRKDVFGAIETNINTKEIYPASRMVATITGIEPQPNKAIVGKNAFAHESGIHQDGVLKCQETYEIMRAEDIGLEKNSIVLGKHSGRHAFKDRANTLGLELTDEELNKAFERFKIVADRKKDIYDDDIRMIVSEETSKIEKTYELLHLQVTDSAPVRPKDGCQHGVPSAVVKIKKADGEIVTEASIGEGVIDAIFKTIDRATGVEGLLKDYKVEAVSEGKQALARVVCKVAFNKDEPAVIGHGLSVDTMIASAKAYLGALNSYVSMKK
jgi:2-isopropylmalate synthase